MGRPRTIETEQILAAAREVFLARGVSATTADVARRVGISQASIFKRFKTKQHLFLAAMAAGPERRNVLELLKRRGAEVGIRAALEEVGETLIPFFRKVLPLVLLSWANRADFGPGRRASKRPAPPQPAHEVVAYLEAEMRAGRLRPADPWLVARAFVGALQNYVLMELVSQGQLAFGPVLSPEVYVRGIVEVLWEGIAPRRAESTSKKTPPKGTPPTKRRRAP